MCFVSFPGTSSSGGQVFGESTVLGGQCILLTSPLPAARFPRWAASAPSQVCSESPLGGWSQAVTLLEDVNNPGSQEDVTSNWKPAQFDGGCLSLGLRLEQPLAFQLWLWPACFSTSGGGGACTQSTSSPLVFAKSFVLWVGQASSQSPLRESSLFFSLWQSDSFGCYLSCVSSLILSPGHSGLVLTLSADYAARASPSSPRSLVVDASLWATSLLTFEVRCVFCEFFFFPSQLCCSLRFQNSPHTHQWEGFLLCGNFSFMTPSPGQVSTPNSFVSRFAVIFCPTSFWREWAAFLGAWCPLASIQKLFCGVCSAFKWSFDEFVCVCGEWYPCPIPLPSLILLFLH